MQTKEWFRHTLVFVAFMTTIIAGRAEQLINVDFGSSNMPKVGMAAYGWNEHDFWNDHVPMPGTFTITNLLGADRVLTGVGLTISNATGFAWAGDLQGNRDAMMATATIPTGGGDMTVTITNLAVGAYDFYVYGHGYADGQVTTFDLAHAGGDYGPKTIVPVLDWRQLGLAEGSHYVVFKVQVVAGQAVVITAKAPVPNALPYLNGLQIIGRCGLDTPPRMSNQVVGVGEMVTFSAATSGTGPVHYQWQFAGTNLAGATNDSLAFVANSPAQAGVYSAVISGGSCSATISASLNFKVVAPVLLNVDFGPVSLKTGFAAIGQSETDQWNTVTATGAAVVSLPNLRAADGRITSVGLIMNNGTGPGNNLAPDPMYASWIRASYGEGPMSVAVTNLLPGRYDFYVYGQGRLSDVFAKLPFELVSGRINYEGKTLDPSPFLGASAWQEGVQYVVFRNVIVSPVDGKVTLKVPGQSWEGNLSGLQIVDHDGLVLDDRLMTQTVIPGQPVTLAVSAKSEAPLNYKWRLGAITIAGATNASYTIPAASMSQTGIYSVTVDNGLNIASSEATLIFRTLTLSGPLTLMLQGAAQSRWRVDYTDALGNPANWQTLTNLTLPASPHLFVDPAAASQPRRFYRATPVP